jgi:hypothetical protein
VVGVTTAYVAISAFCGLLLYVVAGGHAWNRRWKMPLYLAACLVVGLLWLPVLAWLLWDRHS